MTRIDVEARDQRSEAYGENAVDSVSVPDCSGDCVFEASGGGVFCVTCGEPVAPKRQGGR